MNGILLMLSELPGELWLSLTTLIGGYLAHSYKNHRDELKEAHAKEKSKTKIYEIELANLSERQEKIQRYMEESIKQLTKHREQLQRRIDRLEDKISILQKENMDWQSKYNECLVKLARINPTDDTI